MERRYMRRQAYALQSIGYMSLTCLKRLSYSQTDKLLQGQVLKDGDELVSAFGNFRLGFFSPHGTANRYLGIWYKRPTDRKAQIDYYRYIQRYEYINRFRYGCYGNQYNSVRSPPILIVKALKPVWVANRNLPVSGNESTSLTIDSTDGNLKILRNGGNPIAISSVPKAGMKLGINLQTGRQWFLQPWRNDNSPRNGSYVLGMDLNITNKLIIWKDGEVCWKSRLLQNRSLISSIQDPSQYNFSYTVNEQGRYLNYSVNEDVTSFPLLRINAAGEVEDDTGSDILCTTFGGCKVDRNYPNPNYNDPPTPGKRTWWHPLVIAIAVSLVVCSLLSIGYQIRRKYYKTERLQSLKINQFS